MGHVARMGEMRKLYETLVGTREGKRLLGRPRCRREDNTRMDLRETGWEGVDRKRLARDRNQWRNLVNTVMKLWVPYDGMR